ncbi:MAG TPA: ATP-binding protein [Rudaea sp.]
MVTNDFPSTNDRLVGAGPSAAFLEEWTAHRHRTLSDWCSTPWGPFVAALCAASSLIEPEFDEFMQALHLIHGTSAKYADAFLVKPASEPRVREIAMTLPLLIEASPHKDRWTRAELLQALQWSDAKPRRPHRFPVEAFVQRNPVTERALRDAINSVTRGYVALVGPPGTGKSTLLQISLEAECRLIVVRYLAYLPGVGQGLGRGEADDFFLDINSSLRNGGLKGHRFMAATLQERREEFNALLEQAGERFTCEGLRTLIVIDGLDHVPREERPHRSFLQELPLPTAIPDGVVFLLGTQRVDLAGMPPAVQDEAVQAPRLVQISPLSATAVAAMADCMLLPTTIPRSLLVKLAHGHPLATHYLICTLLNADEPASERILSGQFAFHGDIDAVYRSAWRGIRDVPAAIEILGLLARAESPIPPSLLSRGVDEAALELAIKAARHLLRIHAEGWSIFHNSFRIFVLGQPVLRFGIPDVEHSARMYKALANIAHYAPSSSPSAQYELRYLLKAGDHASGLALATASHFRHQFLKGRSALDIQDDIRLAIASLQHVNNTLFSFQLLVATAEMNTRALGVKRCDSLLETMIALGDITDAEAFLKEARVDGYLLVNALMDAGERERARNLYECIEPLHDLDEDWSRTPDFSSWARTAVHFRDSEQICAAVGRIVTAVEDDGAFVSGTDEDPARDELLRAAACAIVESRPETDRAKLAIEFGLLEQGKCELALVAAIRHLSDGNADCALACFESALANLDALACADRSLRLNAGLEAAHGGFTALAKTLLESFQVPCFASLEDRNYLRAGVHVPPNPKRATREVIGYAELARLVDGKLSALPKASSVFLRGLQNHAVDLGRLRAQVELDPSVIRAGDVARACGEFLFLPCLERNKQDERFEKWLFEETAPILVQEFCELAATYGPAEFDRVVSEVDGAIEAGRITGVSIQIALAIHRFAGDGNAAARRLEALVGSLHEISPKAMVSAIGELAKAYAQVSQPELARALLHRAREESLGFEWERRRNPTCTMWLRLLQEANRVDPIGGSDRISLLARQVSGVAQTNDHGAAKRLAHGLIVEAARLDSGTGLAVAHHMTKMSDLIEWTPALDALIIGLGLRSPPSFIACTDTWSALHVHLGSHSEFAQAALGELIHVVIAASPTAELLSTAELLYTAIEMRADADVQPVLLSVLSQATMMRGVESVRIKSATAIEALTSMNLSRGELPLDLDRVGSMGELARHLEANPDYHESAGRAFVRLTKCGSVFADALALFESTPGLHWLDPISALVDLAIDEGKFEAANALVDAYPLCSDRVATHDFAGGRVPYYRVRLRLDGQQCYATAYADFAKWLVDGHHHFRSPLPDAVEVWSVLDPAPNWVEMWLVVAEQLKCSREFRIGESLGPGDTWTDAELIDLLSQIGHSLQKEELGKPMPYWSA